MKILGIDPGLDGGLALVSGQEITRTEPIPVVNVKDSKREYDIAQLVRTIKHWNPDHVLIEKQQAMKAQGVSSMFSIGNGYGIMRGVVVALGIPHTLVHPKTWQKEMFKDLPKSDTKAMSYIVCQRLWPANSWLATLRCKKPHDGMTDAALIAEYGNRLLNTFV